MVFETKISLSIALPATVVGLEPAPSPATETRLVALSSIRIHDLRHSCATLLLVQDVSPAWSWRRSATAGGAFKDEMPVGEGGGQGAGDLFVMR